MKRGEVWTVACGAAYAGKPRPAVILQDERFPTSVSITICVFTTDPTEASMFRVPVEPTRANGLFQPSCLMADKISTVPRTKMGKRIGKLSDADMKKLNRAVVLFLGLAE